MKYPDNYLRLIYLACSLVMFSIPAFGQKDIRSAWNEAFKACGESDVIGPRMIYFGPSNKVGPGSLWRRDEDGGLHLLFELSDAIPDARKRARLIKVNEYASCSQDRTTNWDLSLRLPFVNKLVDATLSAVFSRASKVQISITSLAIDEIKEVPYGIALRDKSVPPEYRNKLERNDSFIIGNSVRVKGLRVELEFDPKVGAEVHAEYKGPYFNTGGRDPTKRDEGAKFSVNWSGDTKVTLESPGEDLYIAGVPSKWQDVSALKEGEKIVPVSIDPDAPLVSERGHQTKR